MREDRARRKRSGASSPAAEKLDVALVAAGAAGEHRGAGYQHIGAGFDDPGGILGGDAALDLELDRPTGGLDHRPQAPNLVELSLDEALSAEAGIDGHHHDEIDVAAEIADPVQRRCRVDAD